MLSKNGSIRGNMVYGNDSIDYNVSARKTAKSAAAKRTEMNTLSQSIRNLTIDNSVNAVRAWSEIQEKIVTSTAAVSQVSERRHKNARHSSSGEESDDLDKFLANIKNSRKPPKKVQTAEEEFIVPDDEVEEEDSSSGRTSPELSLRDRILLKSTNKTRTDDGGGGGTKPKEKKPCVKKPRAKKNKPIIECDNSGSFVPRAKPRPIVISSDESSGHELPSPPTKAFKTPRKPALDDSEDELPSPASVKSRKKKKPTRRNVIKSDSESRSSTPAGTSSTGTPADLGSEDSVASEPESSPVPVPVPPHKPAAADFKTPKSRKKGLREAEEVIGTPTSLTFLSSLTIDTPKYRCHPDALQYVSNFKKKKEELAKRLYHLYNKQIFDGILPADMEITWNVRLTKTAGLCYSRRYKNKFGIETRSSRIELSSKVLDSGDRLRDTLVHEMCHAASWIISGYRDGHGPLWRTWAEKAMQRFPELPVIDRCHSYQIRTKYNYVCVSCNYTIGRHSKSLDTEKKVCGHCHGRFKLVVNATNVASTKANSNKAPATPKAPNAFALFVKENYKTHKKPGVAHKDVMVALSTEFAKFKLQK